MDIVNERYRITIRQDPVYTMDSVDNKPYDMELRALSIEHGGGRYCVYEVAVEAFADGSETRIALIGDSCACVEDDSVLLKGDTLLILLNAAVAALSLEDMQYRIYTLDNAFGRYYAIYSIGSSYLIYGELEIQRADAMFRTVWTYSTQDILTNPQGLPLEIHDGRITVRDWDGNFHELDLDGNLLSYRKREPVVIRIDVSRVRTPEELQLLLKRELGMPEFYGLNWDAYWDAVTGLIKLPDRLILDGWHLYKKRWKDDAQKFEELMNRYEAQRLYSPCECIYVKYSAV